MRIYVNIHEANPQWAPSPWSAAKILDIHFIKVENSAASFKKKMAKYLLQMLRASGNL